MKKFLQTIFIIAVLLICFNTDEIKASNNDICQEAVIMRGPGDYSHYYAHIVVKRCRIRRIQNYFVQYSSQSNSWTYASSYTIKSSSKQDVTFSFEYEGFRQEFKTSFETGLDTTIPADSSRLSRLGLYVDIDVFEETERWDEHDNGKIVKIWYSTGKTSEMVPDSNKILVRYRDEI